MSAARITGLRAIGLVILLASAGCGQASDDGAAGPRDGVPAESRRVAVAPDSVPEGFRFCSAFDVPSGWEEGEEGMVLYGEANRDDPYDGPMLGVIWGEEGDHAGDGTRTPVRVRGRSGEAAPITVFQQVVLEELGTVIAWEESDLSVGFYGRFWDADRTDELVALAEGLVFSDGAFHLPADALPDGYGQVFAGDVGGLSLLFGRSEYWVHYRAPSEDHALVHIMGLVQTDEEFEVIRFFGHGLDVGEVEGRRALLGNAWYEDSGPAVATWREGDGLVVRVVGLGADLETTREVAHASRDLSEEEWDEMVADTDRCPGPAPRREGPGPEEPPPAPSP